MQQVVDSYCIFSFVDQNRPFGVRAKTNRKNRPFGLVYAPKQTKRTVPLVYPFGLISSFYLLWLFNILKAIDFCYRGDDSMFKGFLIKTVGSCEMDDVIVMGSVIILAVDNIILIAEGTYGDILFFLRD